MIETIRAWIDSILNPPIELLRMGIERLDSAQLVTAQGLNVGQYLSIFGDMPTAWQLVVSSILLSSVLLGSLLMFRSIIRIYYSLKEGVKWW